MKPSDWEKVNHFEKLEWQQEPDRVPKELVFSVDQLRETANVPIHILEAFASAGHSDYSYHYIGLAVDLYFEPRKLTPLMQYLYISLFPQFRGIGFYPAGKQNCFWHLDIRNDVPKALWIRTGGKYYYSHRDFLEALCQKDS